MSKHPHNQIILQSNQIKLLHFREALGEKKKPHIFKQLCQSWTLSIQPWCWACFQSKSLTFFGIGRPSHSKAELFRAALSSKTWERWIIKKQQKKDVSVLSDSTAKFSSPYTPQVLKQNMEFSVCIHSLTTSTGTFIAKNLLTCLFLQVKRKKIKEICF